MTVAESGGESPRAESFSTVEGPDGTTGVEVSFNEACGPLMTTNDGAPEGFAVSGPSGTFRWAKARLAADGRTITVWSPDVPDPVEICFAWQNNPARANVTNEQGLPLVPFRADVSGINPRR